jgi:aminoglycoside phosphotransferase (APT) family kinase protein
MSETETKAKATVNENLNLDNLRKYLADNDLISDIESEMKTHRFSGGFSNLTYLLSVEDKEYVLRRPPAGAIKRGHDMGREYKVLSNLINEYTKIPKVYTFSDDKEIIGAPFYIMEKAEGIILDTKEAQKRNLSADQYKVASNTLLDGLVELHNVDYKKTGLADLGKPEGYVARQVENWGKQYYAAQTEELGIEEGIFKWLTENQPKEYRHTLVHNDFKYDNIMFKDDSWKEINTVFDWEMCTLGDPLMDLGTTLSYWITPEDPMLMHSLSKVPTIYPGNPTRAEVINIYSQKSGIPIDDKQAVFYYAFGLVKLAVIVQQIYYRYHNGLTTDSRFADINGFANAMFFVANEAIDQQKLDGIM